MSTFPIFAVNLGDTNIDFRRKVENKLEESGFRRVMGTPSNACLVTGGDGSFGWVTNTYHYLNDIRKEISADAFIELINKYTN